MKRIQIYRGSLVLFLLFFAISPLFLTNPATLHAETLEASASTDFNKKLYNLHHGLVPGILFSGNGALFFNDLFAGNTATFLKIVEESLGKTYADGIKIVPEHSADFDMVLMSFPEPLYEPLNLHAALVRKNGEFRYITLEKGNTIGGSDAKSFFCEWTADHTHKNYGSRDYETLSAFRTELFTFLKQQKRLFSISPRITGEEILMELVRGKKGFSIRVGSNGCTSKGSFTVLVKKEKLPKKSVLHYLLTIIRTVPDECKAIVTDGSVITYDLKKDFGISANSLYSITNQVTAIP